MSSGVWTKVTGSSSWTRLGSCRSGRMTMSFWRRLTTHRCSAKLLAARPPASQRAAPRPPAPNPPRGAPAPMTATPRSSPRKIRHGTAEATRRSGRTSRRTGAASTATWVATPAMPASMIGRPTGVAENRDGVAVTQALGAGTTSAGSWTSRGRRRRRCSAARIIGLDAIRRLLLRSQQRPRPPKKPQRRPPKVSGQIPLIALRKTPWPGPAPRRCGAARIGNWDAT
mmetsp:Transcript_81845/g.226811  ORF Transcript_81845/g.226811 Transcript_81845/m.226811 type:complete len:227 (+) Transcript_81845:941-1621(+)